MWSQFSTPNPGIGIETIVVVTNWNRNIRLIHTLTHNSELITLRLFVEGGIETDSKLGYVHFDQLSQGVKIGSIGPDLIGRRNESKDLKSIFFQVFALVDTIRTLETYRTSRE